LSLSFATALEGNDKLKFIGLPIMRFTEIQNARHSLPDFGAPLDGSDEMNADPDTQRHT